MKVTRSGTNEHSIPRVNEFNGSCFVGDNVGDKIELCAEIIFQLWALYIVYRNSFHISDISSLVLQNPEHEDSGRQTGVQGSAGRYCEGCQERGILFAVEGLHTLLLPVSIIPSPSIIHVVGRIHQLK